MNEAFVKSIFLDKDTLNGNSDDIDSPERHITQGLITPNNDENPDYFILRNWIDAIRGNSKNQSPQTLKKIITFYVGRVLPLLEMESVGEIVGLDAETLKLHLTTEKIFNLCKDPAVNQKLLWLRMFISYIVGVDSKTIIPDEVDALFTARKKDLTQAVAPTQHDFIQMEDLTKIFNALGPYPLFKTMYVVMLTTGLRIGSMVTMRIKNVVDDENTGIRKMARVSCKGRGSSTVPVGLPIRAKEALWKWITTHRPASASPYVFPSKTGLGHMHSDTIRKQFKDITASINIKGNVFHPHALRHTFAHNSLAHGASLSAISCQMHHKSTKTTSEFYLKEDAKYVSAMLHNVFMDCGDVEETPPLPSWLIGENNGIKRAKKRALKERDVNERRQKIKQFKPLRPSETGAI
jgi:integrase